MTVRLNLLLHQHQPDYRAPGGGPSLLPWVRLHAVRGYLDLLSVLERNPRAHCCVNFSGILLEQLLWHAELYAAGDNTPDEWAALSLVPAQDWSSVQRAFALQQFFSANTQNLIRPHQRYWELLQRKQLLETQLGLAAAAEDFSSQDYTDLALLFNLAWVGFTGQRDPRVQRLMQQSSSYQTSQIAELLAIHGELLVPLLSRYGALQEQGAIELSVTPYQHPILPLLCDLQGRGHPDASDPLPDFRHPEDATEQVRRGQALYERAFGVPAAGMWPAEGSVSDAALGVLATSGIRWCATDQANLPRQSADPLAHLNPWRWRHEGGDITVFFRDTRLSDNIGFVYSSWNPRAAVEHFMGIVSSLGHNSGLAAPVVTVALDGENPWENYPDGGEGFLNTLFERLEEHELLETVIPGQLEREDGWPLLEHVHAGSWINGNFDIWSRHPETRQAWRALARAREELADSWSIPAVSAELLAAEGSDWFWWYGDDFSSSSQEIFDLLFRSKLKAAYAAAGRDVPAALEVPICSAYRAAALPEIEALLEVSIDGRVSTYLEWLDAIQIPGDSGQGSMAQSGTSALGALYYGFSDHSLLMRLDLSPDWLDRAHAKGLQVVLCITQGEGEFCLDFHSPGPGQSPPAALGTCALDAVLELEVPLGATGLKHGQPAWIWLELQDGTGLSARFPASGRIGLRIISADFRLSHWAV